MTAFQKEGVEGKGPASGGLYWSMCVYKLAHRPQFITHHRKGLHSEALSQGNNSEWWWQEEMCIKTSFSSYLDVKHGSNLMDSGGVSVMTFHMASAGNFLSLRQWVYNS